jgi:hypothetical protein
LLSRLELNLGSGTLIRPAAVYVRRLPQGPPDPSTTDVLIQHLQDALQMHDSRRIVPVGYCLKRIGKMLDELNILGSLDDRCVHPIE